MVMDVSDSLQQIATFIMKTSINVFYALSVGDSLYLVNMTKYNELCQV